MELLTKHLKTINPTEEVLNFPDDDIGNKSENP